MMEGEIANKAYYAWARESKIQVAKLQEALEEKNKALEECEKHPRV